MEERGAGDLGAVAEHCSQKLVRRHPHVFGEAQADDAAQVLERWDAVKREEEGRAPGALGELPENLPAPIYARKMQRRAAAAGDPQPDIEAALARIVDESRRLGELPGRPTDEAPDPELAPGASRDERFDALGELMYAAVAVAGEHGVDAELALRAAADRRRDRVEEETQG